jgi:hypothetical protein
LSEAGLADEEKIGNPWSDDELDEGVDRVPQMRRLPSRLTLSLSGAGCRIMSTTGGHP